LFAFGTNVCARSTFVWEETGEPERNEHVRYVRFDDNMTLLTFHNTYSYNNK